MTLGPTARDGEIEAFVVDRYLESLLSRQPQSKLDPDVPAELRTTAQRLTRSLPRYHPSFRFEEELAARLQAAATGRLASVVAFPGERRSDPSATPVVRIPVSLDDRAMRPAVIGGVITSAALSLAGAAYVAWRRNRPPTHAMTRAVRAVARTRAV